MEGFGVSIYGKGGIGKSTVSANLSCALAEKGNRVLLIGCDPKHDTTRQIAPGDGMPTVTEYAVRTLPSQRSLDDITRTGRDGIVCVEAGGPRPGVGCAGKGIVTMFQILEKLDDGRLDSEYVLYDVLGDVVCGGFSVPMRPKYTDAVLIVTSGEPMSLYAANNILRGTLGFEEGGGRVAGIVLNRRGIADEDMIVEEFSRAVGIPVIASFDRSELFIEAERSRTPVVDRFPDSDIAESFRGLADRIARIRDGDGTLLSPRPLTDAQFDALIEDGRIDGTGEYVFVRQRTAPPPNPATAARARNRRIGKGGLGSIVETGHVTDIPIVVHGTDSCAISGFDELMARRVASASGEGTGDNISCSMIGLAGSVFGGCDALEGALESLVSAGHDVIVVLATCLSNMIGEDVAAAVGRVEASHPGVMIVLVEASRTDSGYDSHMEVLKGLSALIDPDVEPNSGLVTVVDDTFITLERGRDLEYLDRMLNGMGLGRTRGFLQDCSAEDIRCLRRAGIAVLGEDRKEDRQLRRLLAAKGMRFMERTLPRGISETVPWLEELGRLTGRSAEARKMASEARSAYASAVEKASAALDGVSVAVIPEGDSPVDWIIEALTDAGAVPEIVEPPRGPLSVTEDLSRFGLVIGDAAAAGGTAGPRMRMPSTSVSHLSQIDLLRRACFALRSSLGKGWMDWREPA